MILRATAIVLAILGLWLSAFQASAQPRYGGFGHGGGRGFAAGARWGQGGFRGGGFRGGFRGPDRRGFGGGYPGVGYGRPGFGAPRYGVPGYGGPGYPGPNDAPPAYGGYPRANPGPGFAIPRGGGFGPAGRGMDSGWRAEQDQVRQAVREGRHIPLNQAIEAVRRRAPGHELDAGLEAGPGGRAVYRLRWAGQDGRRRDYLVDAGTGAILGAPGAP